MTDIIVQFLIDNGPARGSAIAAMLQATGLAAEAARKKLSRARPPVMRFKHKLLPKGEGFYYLDYQLTGSRFGDNLLKALRETGSIYGLALDGMSARGGLIPYDQFSVISGAPSRPTVKQVDSERVRFDLVQAGLLETTFAGHNMPQFLRFKSSALVTDFRTTAELVMLDAVREWARKLGFASFNTLSIRNEESLQAIGPFMFDMAGPSWFAPPANAPTNQGFLVADVFAEGRLDEHQIAYFIRKVTFLRAMQRGPRIIPFLIAEEFTGRAMTTGHAAGISLATPTMLFGKRVGAALVSLVETLKKVAAYASSESPDRIVNLINDLSEIEGRNGNLRGILFELAAAYLARRDAVSIEMGTRARTPDGARSADIDILKVTALSTEVTCIECKGKEPGGVVGIDEVRTWIGKIPIFLAYLSNHNQFRMARQRFELWTSGTFSPEALAFLAREKANRTRMDIDWKDGQAVLELALAGREKTIADALKQHFVDNPLASVTVPVHTDGGVDFGSLAAVQPKLPGQAPHTGFMSLPFIDKENF